jgi:hypothetical protein
MNEVSNLHQANPLKIRLAFDRGQNDEALEAKHGNFSEKYFRTMSAALRKAPPVVEHVMSLITGSGGPEDRVDGSREPPLPMSLQAYTDVNEIYSLLVYWTRAFATGLHVQAPGPAVRAWRNERGTIVGLPAGTDPATARYLVGIMATWLDIHLEAICALDPEDVTALHNGLKYIFQTDARWPQEERARYSDMPCPDDGGKIALYPPAEFGADERVICETCGRHYTVDQYEDLVGIYRRAATDKQAATIAARHLMKKYGMAS